MVADFVDKVNKIQTVENFESQGADEIHSRSVLQYVTRVDFIQQRRISEFVKSLSNQWLLMTLTRHIFK